MRTKPAGIAVAIGAMLGGLIVGPFHVEPAWLWGMGGGLWGGLLGYLCALIAAKALHPALRFLLATVVLALGYALLWLVVGREWLFTQMRSMHPPG